MEEKVKWEYKIIGIKRKEDQEFSAYADLVTRVFDAAGEDGWELVSVDNDIGYFRRRFFNKFSYRFSIEIGTKESE